MDFLADTFPGFNKTAPIRPATAEHLRQVLQLLTTLCATAAVSIWLNIAGIASISPLWSVLASGMAMIAYASTPSNEFTKRQGLVMAMAFLQGQNVAPIVHWSHMISETLVLDAVVSTGLVFSSFLLACIYFPQSRAKMYILSLVSSACTVMFYLTTFSWFLGRRAFMTELYLGLASFSLYLVLDLQNMIDGCEQGHRKDVIHDSLTIFTNLIQLFARILVYLQQQERRKEEKKRRKQHQ